jgi:hypothetical protein
MKHAILALEQATVTSDLSASATTIPVTCKVMTTTPFVAGDGRPYTIMDETFAAGVNGLPNSEKFEITAISGNSATPLGDSIGYTYVATLHIQAYTTSGWGGGLANSYKMANNCVILIPGVEMAIQSSDFNARFKTLTDAPKVEFDDESSRMATGDEGRDKSIAGARSAEINFTEKLAWAGSFDAVPVWDKLLKSMGHLKKFHTPGVDLGTATSPTTCADLETLITTYDLSSGDYFHTDGTDTTDSALVAIKGSAIANHDSFQVGSSKKQLGVAVTPSAHLTLAALIAAKSFVNGSIFNTVDGSDTTTPSLAVAKALLTAEPLGAYDSFLVGAGSTITYLAQTARYSAAGIEYLPSIYSNEITATIWVITPENGLAPSSTCYRYVGAHGGNGSSISVGKIGDPYMLTGKYSAAYIGTQELAIATARAFTSNYTQVPEVLINNTVTVPAYINGISTVKAVEISQFNLDFGGIVNPFIDQSTTTGYAFYATQDRDPKLTINPYHVRKSLDDVDYVVSNMITGEVVIKSAPTSPHITIEIPNGQLLSPTIGSREGYVSTDRTYRALRNNLGNGPSDALIPDNVMYSVLIGSRS